MSRLQRKNSLALQVLGDKDIKQLKELILQMEDDPSIFDELGEDQIFGIVFVILNKSSYHRTQSEIMILKKATKHIGYFQKLLEKEEGSRLWERCLRKMSYTALRKGETLFREGDVGKTFYIILQGRVSIHKRILVGDIYQDKELTQLSDGQAFGELALENNEPRSATITAIFPTHLAVLDQEDYMVIKKTVINQQRQMYFEEFAKLQVFKDWKFFSIKSLFDVIKQNKFPLNHIVYKEGDISSEVYFISTGEFKVVKSLRNNQQFDPNNEQLSDLEFLRQQFAYNEPQLSNQERIDKLYQKKKYGNLMVGEKKINMTLKFLGAGEMFGELEILKQIDLCRQFSMISTQESNIVFSVEKRDFLRILNNDKQLSINLINLNDSKLKQLLNQIKIYEKNFIDQSEKNTALENTQNKAYLHPSKLTSIEEQIQTLQRTQSQIFKITSRATMSENKLREMTLTLDSPEPEHNSHTNVKQVRHSRQLTKEAIQLQIQSRRRLLLKKKQTSQKQPNELLAQTLDHISQHIKKLPTQLTPMTQRKCTSPSNDTVKHKKSQIFFDFCLPLVLQNNYYKLKTKH